VFVHGACVKDGGWWWQLTAERLQSRDVLSEAVALPSCGELDRAAGLDGPGFNDDVAELRRALTRTDEAVTVVAHSYGGIVTAEAAADVAAVTQLVLISSYLPEVGESLSSFGGDAPAPFLDVDPDRATFAVRPDRFIDTFMHDCPAEVVAQSVQHLARQSISVIGEPVRASAWQQVPSTYVVCTGDRGTPAERQRDFARRATSVVEVDSGHHPFLSRPDVIADIVLGGRYS
jgi:pimeloyl-ACP methyl ester carboxylesterase